MAVAGTKGYFNGSDQGVTFSAVGMSPHDHYPYIGASNYLNAPEAAIIGNVQAFVLFNALLNATDVATITTRMQALA